MSEFSDQQSEIQATLASDRVYLINRLNSSADNIIINGIPTLFKKGQKANYPRHIAVQYCKANPTRIDVTTGETTESIFGIAEMDKDAESKSKEWPATPLSLTQADVVGKLKRDLRPGEESVAVRPDGSIVDVKSKGAIDMATLRAEITAQIKADMKVEVEATEKAEAEAATAKGKK